MGHLLHPTSQILRVAAAVGVVAAPPSPFPRPDREVNGRPTWIWRAGCCRPTPRGPAGRHALRRPGDGIGRGCGGRGRLTDPAQVRRRRGCGGGGAGDG